MGTSCVFRELPRPALRDLEIKKGYVCGSAAAAGVVGNLFTFTRVRSCVCEGDYETDVSHRAK